MKLLLLSDGKPGHLTSSRGIAQHLADVEVEELELQFQSKQRDNRLRVLTRLTAWSSPSDGLMEKWLESALTPESHALLLGRNRIDAILSTGSSVAAVNLSWGRVLGVPSFVCRWPSPLGIQHFDQVILPRYQWPKRARANVVRVLGIPNQITPSRLMSHRPSEIPLPCIGLFIGGLDPYFTITPETAQSYANVLLNAVETLDVGFAITMSRRTPVDVERVFIERLGRHDRCLLFVPVHTDPSIVGMEVVEEPVHRIMAMSDILVVTEDSYSMVCEALSSSRPVVMAQIDRQKRSRLSRQMMLPKRQEDYAEMAQSHCLLFGNHTDLASRLEEAFSRGWPQPPLRDAEQAAAALAESLSHVVPRA